MKSSSPETLTERLKVREKVGNLFASPCPSREILKHVCSRWGVLALISLQDGTHRFSELRKRMGGVSEKMLAQTLQALEQDGFVERVAFPVVPPHVEYSLTELGKEVSVRVAELADWIEYNLPQMLEAQAAYAERLEQESATETRSGGSVA